ENSFHGRTIATLSATGQPRFHEGFMPLLEGFRYCPFNDIDALKAMINEKTCAIMIELIQSEGGIYVAGKEYIQAIRRLADEKDILLIVDEMQTGMGRTGQFFGYEHFGIEPDIMTLAKALGNGFPVGAMIAKDRVMNAFVPGTHASTFGGNPLAMSAVIATLNTIIDEGIIKDCEAMGRYLFEGLMRLKQRFPFIIDVRGMGLILGIELSINGDDILREFMDEGVILNCTKGKILRLLPPLIITEEDVDLFLEIASRVFDRHIKAGA
ncbi:MAG: aminotransferase class III-fold pyridoxal phosphate-dependent enzyme, partial [Syntrophorhabdaceae bacterium]|nr:aminotransferase class III-fold pyridoxal phosphate-dependent enzyme [Syntrophorhabdaceae bacterium]